MRFRCGNFVTLSFRKALPRKSNKMSALVEEVCDEIIDKVFNKILSQSVQCLVAKKVANELSLDCVPCDMDQGDKTGSSTVRELAKRKDKFATKAFPDGVNLTNKLLNVVKHFEANPINRKTMIKF